MKTAPDTPEGDLVPAGVIVVELDDVVPRRHPDKPNLYVASTRSPIEKRFTILQQGKGPAWIHDRIVHLRSDLSIPTQSISRSRARTQRQVTIKNLHSAGFTVNRNTQTWTVYVVELDVAAVKDPGKGVVYVGETSLTPEERFDQHMTKAMSSKGARLYSPVVARWGIGLRMDLAPAEKVFDKESSKRVEAEWAEHLRSLGYVVKGGH